MSRVVVIGGGVAGLATAALLSRDGHRVTVVERSGTTGGRAGSWEHDGFRFDTGPSWYLMPECFEHFFGLCEERVEDHLELTDLVPAYRVFPQTGEPLEVISGREQAAALFESVEPGAGAALRRYLDSAHETYEVAREHFLYSTFSRIPGGELVRLLPRIGTFARLLLESLHDRVSRTVTDGRLRQILGYPAVFLAATPRTAPSIYHLMSWMDLEDGVRYPQGGFARLVTAIERLARAGGARIRTGTEVTAIRTARLRGPARLRGRRARVTGVTVSVRTPEGERVEQIDADVVVSAADLHHTETELIPAELSTYPEDYWRRRVSGPGAVLALLGVEGPLPELAHHNLLFTEDWDENFDQILGGEPRVPDPASTYVCKPSQSDPTVAPEGHENLFVLIPVSPDAEDGASVGHGGVGGTGSPAVERAVDRAIAQISAWAGVDDLEQRIRVRRSIGPADFAEQYHSWRGNALGPAHVLSQSAFLRGSNRSRRIDGLLYAGATTAPGVGLPMCLISAENVVKRLRGDHSGAPLPVHALRSAPGAGPPRRRPGSTDQDSAGRGGIR